MASKHVHQPVRVVEFCACGATREDHGDWAEGKGKNRAARELVMRQSPPKRKANAALGGRASWEGSTESERRAIMTEMAKRPRPAARIADRCDCGMYSRVTAERRGHKCGKGN